MLDHVELRKVNLFFFLDVCLQRNSDHVALNKTWHHHWLARRNTDLNKRIRLGLHILELSVDLGFYRGFIGRKL